MKANFVARKFVITDDIRDTFNKKFKRFDRFFPEDTEITATLKEERNGVRVELTIVDRGYFYRAEQSASEPIAAVDLCVDIIEGQIRNFAFFIVASFCIYPYCIVFFNERKLRRKLWLQVF